jgi:hypothetical protein
MEILTISEIDTILSMSRYWDEVSKRENCGEILRAEFRQLYSMFELKLLDIIADYAKKEKERIKNVITL